MSEMEQYSKICKPQLDEINGIVKDVRDCVLGNGKPGLKTELAVVKARQSWLIAIIVFLVITFVAPFVKDRLWGNAPCPTSITKNDLPQPKSKTLDLEAN